MDRQYVSYQVIPVPLYEAGALRGSRKQKVVVRVVLGSRKNEARVGHVLGVESGHNWHVNTLATVPRQPICGVRYETCTYRWVSTDDQILRTSSASNLYIRMSLLYWKKLVMTCEAKTKASVIDQ